jgi:hypothetical protein
LLRRGVRPAEVARRLKLAGDLGWTVPEAQAGIAARRMLAAAQGEDEAKAQTAGIPVRSISWAMRCTSPTLMPLAAAILRTPGRFFLASAARDGAPGLHGRGRGQTTRSSPQQRAKGRRRRRFLLRPFPHQ